MNIVTAWNRGIIKLELSCQGIASEGPFTGNINWNTFPTRQYCFHINCHILRRLRWILRQIQPLMRTYSCLQSIPFLREQKNRQMHSLKFNTLFRDKIFQPFICSKFCSVMTHALGSSCFSTHSFVLWLVTALSFNKAAQEHSVTRSRSCSGTSFIVQPMCCRLIIVIPMDINKRQRRIPARWTTDSFISRALNLQRVVQLNWHKMHQSRNSTVQGVPVKLNRTVNIHLSSLILLHQGWGHARALLGQFALDFPIL